MKNREWLSSQNEYDLLVSCNDQINKNTNRIVCIIECFMHSIEAGKRCAEFENKCPDCIQSWMNEERR